jgi:hypothetical protein
MPRGGLQTSLVSMVNMLAAPFRRRTSTGPRRGASAGRGARICRAPVGAHLSRGPPRSQNARTLNATRSNVIVYPTSYGAWQTGRSNQVLHHHRQQGRQRAVILAQQHAAVRPRPLPAFHDDRQCPGAAAAAGGGVRHRPGRAEFTASRWGRSRRSIGRHCSPTGSSGSRRSAVRPRPRPTISFFSSNAFVRSSVPPTWLG